MKTQIALAMLVAAAFGPAGAADVPSTPAPRVAAPAVDRMANARRAIEVRDWALAVRELQQVVRESPRNADAHNLLGYSYRKSPQPDYVKAFEHYDIALKIDPRHRGAREYIGEAYLEQGKPAEAQAQLAQLEQICGNRTCEEYEDLAKAIADYKAAH